MQIVRAKVDGQAANLPPGNAQDRLKGLRSQIRSGDPSNIEAQAAKIYWAHVFGSSTSFRRDRRGSGRNSLLNYGYSVLRGAVVRSIVAAGLSPTLSVHHRHRANVFALADDLIEPFRPAIDATVKVLSEEASLSEPEVKGALVGSLGQPMGESGTTVQTAIGDLVSNFARYVEGDGERLLVPRWRNSHG